MEKSFQTEFFVPFYLIGLAFKHFLFTIILLGCRNAEEHQCNFVTHGICKIKSLHENLMMKLDINI